MIDSHCHLDHEPLRDNLKDVILRSKKGGINKILTICTNLESYKNIKNIINIDEMIYGTFGIHPHEAAKDKVSTEKIIKEVLSEKKIIGVGETGLDFYYNNSDKISQIDSFIQHIEASIYLKVPIIIHSRNAETQTFEILNKYAHKNLKILMHCFTGSQNFAKKMMDLNAYFSASGIITFKNSTDLQNTFKNIPDSKLLIETDSPFLAPVPMRGKKNEPSYIKYTLEKLSSLKNKTVNEMDIITTKNFNNLFDHKCL